MPIEMRVQGAPGHLDGEMRADGIIELIETRGGYAPMIRTGIALDMTI